jgi:hypothetical protein
MQGTQEETETTSQDLDLDQWLADRLLLNRRIKVGGKWFRFDAAVSSEKLIELNKLMQEGDLASVLKILLVNRKDEGALDEAYRKQRTPAGAKQEREFTNALITHLFAGADVGESSAS